MWEKLKGIHVVKKAGTRFDAYTSHFSSLYENESLSDLIARVDDSLTYIKEHRSIPFTLDDLDAELCSMALIQSLPADYNTFVTYLTMKDNLSLDSVTSAFLNEEQSRARRNQEESRSRRSQATLLRLRSPSHVVRDSAEIKYASALAKQKTAGLSGSSGTSGNGNGKRGGHSRG